MPIDISSLKVEPYCYGVSVAKKNMLCRHCGDIPKGAHILRSYANGESANICRGCMEKAMVAFHELDRLIAAGLPTSQEKTMTASSTVVLINPKYPRNVGAALRACSYWGTEELLYSYDKTQVAVSGYSIDPEI